MVDVEIKPENLDCIPYIEIKPEILNFVPVESNNDHESLSAIPIKVEADDPLNSFHEGYYVIQCKCYVMVKRSDKSVQCNLYEEEIETKEISIVNIENTNNIIDTNENNYNDVTVDYEEDNTNNIIETNAYNDNNVTVDYDNITCNSISESSEDETKFEELFAKTEKIYEEAYTLVNGGYKCNKCGKISGNRGKFLRHSVSHQEHSTLCYGCGKLYSKNDSTHIAICSSLNKRKNNEKNINVLTEYKRQERGSLEIRQCRDCGKRIKSILEGNDHQNIHKNLKPYQCSCGSKCRYFSNFIIHLKKFKCPIDKCIIPEYAPQNIQLWIDRESKYKPIFGNYANKKITNAYRTKKLLPDSELNCKECGIEKFPNYVRYREHLESKHLERKFVCKDKRCGHKFATERKLRDHVKNIHLIQHKCDKCNLVFSRTKLKRHNLTCAGLNMEKITVSNYKTTFRNQLFYCSICTEHEEHQKINKHFSHDYHKKLEELWKQKHNIKQYKCTKCKYLTKESICDFFIHLEKIHKCCFILQINDIFKSFESAQPFIFNDDIEEPDRMDIAIDE